MPVRQACGTRETRTKTAGLYRGFMRFDARYQEPLTISHYSVHLNLWRARFICPVPPSHLSRKALGVLADSPAHSQIWRVSALTWKWIPYTAEE